MGHFDIGGGINIDSNDNKALYWALGQLGAEIEALRTKGVRSDLGEELLVLSDELEQEGRYVAAVILRKESYLLYYEQKVKPRHLWIPGEDGVEGEVSQELMPRFPYQVHYQAHYQAQRENNE